MKSLRWVIDLLTGGTTAEGAVHAARAEAELDHIKTAGSKNRTPNPGVSPGGRD
jgi:hypothetical protein